jgi:glucose-6-phosphate isomerase
VVERPDAPASARRRPTTCTSSTRRHRTEGGTTVDGPLGAQFLVWEYATAVAGRVIGIDPFNQPNVAESKANTSALLDESGDGPLPEGEPLFVDGGSRVRRRARLGGATDLRTALDALLAAVPAAVSRRHGLPRPARRRASRGAAPAARRAIAQQVTFGGGPALPALDRAVPQGRPAARRLPADHRRRPATSTCRAGVHLSAAAAAQALGDCARCPHRRPPAPATALRIAGRLAQLLRRRDRERPVRTGGAQPLRDPAGPAAARIAGPCAWSSSASPATWPARS